MFNVDEVKKHLQKAEEKHPDFCERITADNNILMREIILENARRMAEKTNTAEYVLFEEISEIYDAYAKHEYNHGSADDLPKGVSWDKESYTYATNDAEIIARDLIERGMCSDSQLMQQLTISQIAKASGMTADGIVSKYPDIITAKPKERVLRIR